ncbi:MAG: hypothetical protein J7621_20770 [Niastella sp.]|nr:hypothetical protein [Niastella sp.]
MKISLTLSAILIILLSACNSNDTKTPSAATGDTTSTTTTTLPKDTSAVVNAPKESVLPPEESDTLKFCHIRKFYEKNGTQFIDADYIQFLFGDKAVAAARKRNDAEMEIENGDTVYSVPNDYYAINDNPRIRSLALDKNVRCSVIDMRAEVYPTDTTLKSLQSMNTEDKVFILTLDKNNVVTRIKEQFIP